MAQNGGHQAVVQAQVHVLPQKVHERRSAVILAGAAERVQGGIGSKGGLDPREPVRGRNGVRVKAARDIDPLAQRRIQPAAVACGMPRSSSCTTSAPARSATATVSSVEPLSTTMMRSGRRVCCASASKHAASMGASLSDGMTTARESTGGSLCRG